MVHHLFKTKIFTDEISAKAFFKNQKLLLYANKNRSGKATDMISSWFSPRSL